jgi:DNA-binding NarL/FixJ family response regulator
MKILLADAHHEVRTALRLVLEQEPGIHVVGEARSTLELFSQLTNECPHVVLLDTDLPGLQMSRRVTRSPLGELVEILHKLCPALRVIGLSSLPSAEKDCALAKADAFFCKSDPPDALLALLQQMQPGTDITPEAGR